MELPTYTSIWRIEKRLYKLYDFRLPMPLPVGQIVVFTAITVPYVLLLALFGLPLDHTLFWLYVLPPGALTWLATRPVLESKRLPELLISQVRYLAEPPTWCRMAPLAEEEEIVVMARVWRRAAGASGQAARLYEAPVAGARAAAPARSGRRRAAADAGRGGSRREALPVAPQAPVPVLPDRPVRADSPAASARPVAVRAAGASGAGSAVGVGRSATAAPPPFQRSAGRAAPAQPPPTSDPAPSAPAAPGQEVASAAADQVAAGADPGQEAAGAAVDPVVAGDPPAPEVTAAPVVTDGPPALAAAPVPSASTQLPSARPTAVPGPAQPPTAHQPATAQANQAVSDGQPNATAPETTGAATVHTEPATPPVVVVPAQRGSARRAPMRSARPVERALSGPAPDRSVSWRDRVTVVPGGRGPGRPNFEQRDAARAVQPLEEHGLVMVLGCTVGAGQTVTTLMLADLLASLRTQPVAAVDVNPGPGSLTQQARTPAITTSALLAAGPPASATPRARGRGRLDVIVDDAATRGGPADEGELDRVFQLLAARYQLALADPGAAMVSRVLAIADQLVLVAPASPDAARALAMTREWLCANGYEALADGSITVINGVSKRSLPHAQQAELVARGRCRAIVRIPWDDHLAEPEAEREIRSSRVDAGGSSRAGQLRPPVRQAYTALAGVLVTALTASPGQRRAAP